jgi:hypothetical protein
MRHPAGRGLRLLLLLPLTLLYSALSQVQSYCLP